MNQKQSSNLKKFLGISSIFILTLGITSNSLLNTAYAAEGINSVFTKNIAKTQPGFNSFITKISTMHEWKYLTELLMHPQKTFVHLDVFSLSHKSIHV